MAQCTGAQQFIKTNIKAFFLQRIQLLVLASVRKQVQQRVEIYKCYT
jgi:hypothetical protein